jgi:OmpA-OmpF porin, OOP family
LRASTREEFSLLNARREHISTLAFVAAVGALPAHAADCPWYVEAEVGRADIVEAPRDVAFDDATTSFRIANGYLFLPALGIELAYADLGSVEAGPIRADAEGFGVDIHGTVTLVGHLALAAEAGNLWWRAAREAFGKRSESTGNDLYYGFGLEYALSDHLVAVANWRRYDLDHVSVAVRTIGVRLRFGETPETGGGPAPGSSGGCDRTGRRDVVRAQAVDFMAESERGMAARAPPT